MLSPKSVLITGANRGIGLEFVKQFLKLPTPPKYLFASCRSPENAEDLETLATENSNLNIIKLDMSDIDSFVGVRNYVNNNLEHEGLNLLINNAGIVQRHSLTEVTVDVMMELYKINTVAPLMLAKSFLPSLKRAASNYQDSSLSCNRAAIVNITSKVGSCDDNKSGGRYPYRCSKAALNMATKSMSIDLKEHGILAVALHPGWVQTDMGGINALIDTSTSVAGMMQVMSGLNDETNGLMFDYAGKLIPW